MQWLEYIGFIFVLYSFLGWCLEEVYCFCITKHFKDDEFLTGPFKPMYGFAIALIVFIYELMRINGFLLAMVFIIVPTLIEYISGYILRKGLNKEYWDYSGNRYNYKGLICLKFSIYWTMLTILVIFTIQPIVVKIYNKFSYVFKFIVPILIVYLVLDLVGTIKLLNYNKVISRK